MYKVNKNSSWITHNVLFRFADLLELLQTPSFVSFYPTGNVGLFSGRIIPFPQHPIPSYCEAPFMILSEINAVRFQFAS